MAYDKFKANVLATGIQVERDRAAVLVADCNREYEGEVKDLGDSVTIKGAGKVSVTTVTDGSSVQFGNPEFIEGTDTIMTIKHATSFDFAVPDIDSAQGAKGALSIYQKQAGVEIANEQDTLVASLANDVLARKDNSSAVKITVDNVLTTIDNGIKDLWEHDVPQTERIILNVSPRFYMLLKQKYMALDTNNTDMVKRGAVAMYGNVDVKLTNNIYTTTSGTVDYIMLRTAKAIAFANPLTKIEAKRANNYMADEVRGVSLYDAKIIAPKELIVLNCKYA